MVTRIEHPKMEIARRDSQAVNESMVLITFPDGRTCEVLARVRDDGAPEVVLNRPSRGVRTWCRGHNGKPISGRQT